MLRTGCRDTRAPSPPVRSPRSARLSAAAAQCPGPTRTFHASNKRITTNRTNASIYTESPACPACAGVAFGCGETLSSQSRLLFQPGNQLVAQAASLVPWSQASRDAELLRSATELFERHTPNDFVYMLLTLIDAAVSKARPFRLFPLKHNTVRGPLGGWPTPTTRAGARFSKEPGHTLRRFRPAEGLAKAHPAAPEPRNKISAQALRFSLDSFTQVKSLSVNKKTTLSNLFCMVKNCSPQIYACVSDPQCKAALDCLESCGLNDQVCSYRCIVSYESELFEKFTLCNLLKHNCLDNSAAVPTLPLVPVMESWRGEAMTHELAEQIFIGWLNVDDAAAWLPKEEKLPWSWKARRNSAHTALVFLRETRALRLRLLLHPQVVCGQNPAYDSAPAPPAPAPVFWSEDNPSIFFGLLALAAYPCGVSRASSLLFSSIRSLPVAARTRESPVAGPYLTPNRTGFPCQHQIFYYGKNKKSFWCAHNSFDFSGQSLSRSSFWVSSCAPALAPLHALPRPRGVAASFSTPSAKTHHSLPPWLPPPFPLRYDPVFQVIKLDGEPVWRKRHYAVRRGKRPGTFVFR